MSGLEFIVALLLLIALGCKAYAVLKPNAGLHNWAWGFLWLAVFMIAFGSRVVGP